MLSPGRSGGALADRTGDRSPADLGPEKVAKFRRPMAHGGKR